MKSVCVLSFELVFCVCFREYVCLDIFSHAPEPHSGHPHPAITPHPGHHSCIEHFSPLSFSDFISMTFHHPSPCIRCSYLPFVILSLFSFALLSLSLSLSLSTSSFATCIIHYCYINHHSTTSSLPHPSLFASINPTMQAVVNVDHTQIRG